MLRSASRVLSLRPEWALLAPLKLGVVVRKEGDEIWIGGDVVNVVRGEVVL
jgi:hypothetical protein